MTSRTAGGPTPAPERRELAPADAMAQLSFLVHGMLERLADEQHLSIIQTRLLGVLRDREPTMNELANLLGLEKSSVTGLIDRAERRGLVARIPSSEDRRAIRVRLSDEGRSLMADVSARFNAEAGAALDRLPPADATTLIALISQLLVAQARDQGIDLLATETHSPSDPRARTG